MEDNDPIIQSLKQEIEALDRRRAVLARAVADLTGTVPPPTVAINGRRPVGEDKVDAVREYIRKKGKVRQAEITKELGFNSGTTSEAIKELMRIGEVEKGPKEDRSVTLRYAG